MNTFLSSVVLFVFEFVASDQNAAQSLFLWKQYGGPINHFDTPSSQTRSHMTDGLFLVLPIDQGCGNDCVLEY